jgi:hypothetical protein
VKEYPLQRRSAVAAPKEENKDFTTKARRIQRSKAATKDEKTDFTTKVTKSTKLRSLKITMSETFVAFVSFVVRERVRHLVFSAYKALQLPLRPFILARA